MRSFPRLAAAAALALATREVQAQAPTKVTVRPGDTCASIAARHYGDARLVDLIHSANPSMGPPPHALRAGTVLLLPPKVAPPAGPDARLTRPRNRVEVRAPEPRAGKPDDPLFRGNRVGTRDSSSADVTFRDETQVKLGENTIIVILGDARAEASRVATWETTLVTGSLRSRLSELAGKTPAKPQVTTDSGAVVLKEGESQVSVDGAKTTRVAVYGGGSTLTAQKKTVEVKGGFGSKAEMGRPPTPPAPLPEAPRWTTAATLVVTRDPTATFDLAFERSSDPGPGPPPASWHVQLSRDADFADLVVDAEVPLATQAIAARSAGPGRYWARASAIDADRFEGPWSTVAGATVAALAVTPLPGRRARVEVSAGVNGLVSCEVDGVPATELLLAHPRVMGCKTADGARAAAALPAVPLGALSSRAEIVANAGARSGMLRVRVRDEAGIPVEDEVTVVSSPRGVHVGPLARRGAGAYYAPVTFDDTATSGPVRLRLGDATVETNVVDPPKREPARLELVAAGRVVAFKNTHRGAIGIGLGARLSLPIAPGRLLVGLEGTDDRVLRAKGQLHGEGMDRVRGNVWSIRAPVGLRLGADRSLLAPYVTLAPELLFTDVRAQTRAARPVRVEGTSTAAAVGLAFGLELRTVARAAVFVEAGGRLEVFWDRSGWNLSTHALVFSLGHRLAL